MPIIRNVLKDSGFELNRRDTQDPTRVETPPVAQVPLSDIPLVIPNASLDLSKLNLSLLNPNEDVGTKNFVPGVSGWRIYGAGNVEFNDGVFRGTLTASSIHIPDQTTTDSFHTNSSGDSWWGANVADYTSSPANAKARMTKEGNGYFQNIEAKGIMKGVTHQYDVVSAVGGQLLVSNADTLDTAMTALDASTLTTKGTTTWAVNDMLLIQADNGSGIQTEYL